MKESAKSSKIRSHNEKPAGKSVPTPWGEFYLEATERGMYSLSFPNGNGAAAGKRVGAARRAASTVEKHLLKAGKLLQDYFAGKAVSFAKIPVDWSGTTAFEKKILRRLAKLPPGKIETYSGLAKLAGSPGAARGVGGVMRKNRLPIMIPCHRVLHTGGGLGGYSGGLAWKKRLLKLEGIKRTKQS